MCIWRDYQTSQKKDYGCAITVHTFYVLYIHRCLSSHKVFGFPISKHKKASDYFVSSLTLI